MATIIAPQSLFFVLTPEFFPMCFFRVLFFTIGIIKKNIVVHGTKSEKNKLLRVYYNRVFRTKH